MEGRSQARSPVEADELGGVLPESPVGTRDEGSFEGRCGKDEFSGPASNWPGRWKGLKAAFEGTNANGNGKQENSGAILLSVT